MPRGITFKMFLVPIVKFLSINLIQIYNPPATYECPYIGHEFESSFINLFNNLIDDSVFFASIVYFLILLVISYFVNYPLVIIMDFSIFSLSEILICIFPDFH